MMLEAFLGINALYFICVIPISAVVFICLYIKYKLKNWYLCDIFVYTLPGSLYWFLYELEVYKLFMFGKTLSNTVIEIYCISAFVVVLFLFRVIIGKYQPAKVKRFSIVTVVLIIAFEIIIVMLVPPLPE